MNQKVEIFLSYAPQDRHYAQELLDHLEVLKYESPSVHIWSEKQILPGTVKEQAIYEHLNKAQIILVLISPNFFSSDREMQLIEEKLKSGKAPILPIIMRPLSWKESFLAKLEPLPANGKALSQWTSRDLAYQEIIDKIKETVKNLNSPAKVDREEKQLRKVLEAFSEQELLTLALDLRLNISFLLEDRAERSVDELPKISVDRLLQYMGEKKRIEELANYIRKNLPTANLAMEDV